MILMLSPYRYVDEMQISQSYVLKSKNKYQSNETHPFCELITFTATVLMMTV